MNTKQKRAGAAPRVRPSRATAVQMLRVEKPTRRDRADHGEYPAMERAVEALAAADVYVTRLVGALQEIVTELRDGDPRRGREDLKGAVAGIRCLADILAAVGRATGLDTLPSTDQELGHLALTLGEIALHEHRTANNALSALIEDDLIPALTRLAPTFPQLEARVASLV